MIKIRVPATTANLGPGFDCLGLALKLYLNLEIEETEKGLVIEYQGEGAEKFSVKKDTLIGKSAELVLKKIGQDKSKKGLKIKTFNQIPVTRGLGSSAAAIIGGIMGAARICKIELSFQEMLELALSLEGHLDNIVPALMGGLTLAYKTEQEEIKWARIDTPADLRAVLAIPDFSLSTEEMRRVLPSKTSLVDAVFNLSRSALLVNALQNSNWEVLAEAMEDKLHQPFRAPFIPGIEEMFSQIKRTGLAGVALSGSGPTVVSLTKRGSEELISNIMKNIFFKEGIDCRILVLETDLEGTKIVYSR
ncbi:homoserine kinase [Candidatus Atribacteria bacterium CG2_30_33_13]|uniref:Homoserine kinase n=2 Tax=Candidatus Infernicultor aquiphilus TaxID=1805029 RepID=A0A1J5GPZ4_9BACT|nr:MAG: homoserine kinase [Candidatus Atribacteria bacterium CG2_30_33_13]